MNEDDELEKLRIENKVLHESLTDKNTRTKELLEENVRLRCLPTTINEMIEQMVERRLSDFADNFEADFNISDYEYEISEMCNDNFDINHYESDIGYIVDDIDISEKVEAVLEDVNWDAIVNDNIADIDSMVEQEIHNNGDAIVTVIQDAIDCGGITLPVTATTPTGDIQYLKGAMTCLTNYIESCEVRE